MSELHDIIGNTVDDRAPFTSDTVVNLRDNSTFTAEIEANVDINAMMFELGEDIREAVILHVRSQSEAANIQSQDDVRFTLFGQETTCRVIKRRNNPGNPFAEFWAQRIVNDLDA